jgi:hypothetical protein
VVRGGGNEHYRTIETLEFSVDPERKLIPKLDALRRKRNTGAYDDYGLVSQGEADLAGKLAGQVRNRWKTGSGETIQIGFDLCILLTSTGRQSNATKRP